MNIIKRVEGLVVENRLKEAIEVFKEWSFENDKEDFGIRLSNLGQRLEKLKLQKELELISYTEYVEEQLFISNTIVDAIHRLKAKIELNEIDEDQRKTILFLCSSPEDLAVNQLEKEFLQISKSLQNGNIEYKLVAKDAVTPNKLQAAILKYKPNIVHFSGHGQKSADNLPGGIMLQDTSGLSKLVKGSALANFFRVANKKSDINIEIVLLNACYSEEQALAIKEYVPHVIGMNNAILDDAAIEFSTGFYRALPEGEDIEFAFEMAVSMIQLEGLDDDKVPVLLGNPEK